MTAIWAAALPQWSLCVNSDEALPHPEEGLLAPGMVKGNIPGIPPGVHEEGKE